MQASHRTKLVQFRNSRLIVIFALLNFLQCIAFTVAVPSFPFFDTQDDSQNSIDDPPNTIGPHIGVGPLRPPSADANLVGEVDFQKSFHKGPTTTTTPPPYYYTPTPPYYTTTPYYSTPYYPTGNQPPYYPTGNQPPNYPTGNQPPNYPTGNQPPYYQTTPAPYYPPQQYQSPPQYATQPHYQPPRNALPPNEPSHQSAPCAEHHDNQFRRVSPKFSSYGWGM